MGGEEPEAKGRHPGGGLRRVVVAASAGALMTVAVLVPVGAQNEVPTLTDMATSTGPITPAAHATSPDQARPGSGEPGTPGEGEEHGEAGEGGTAEEETPELIVPEGQRVEPPADETTPEEQQADVPPEESAGNAATAIEDPVVGGIVAAAAETLTTTLGTSRTAGIHLNDDGRIVIAVVDEVTGNLVRTAGGIAQVVKHSTDHLQSITSKLDESIATPGTAWGIDPIANQVVIEADPTVSATALGEIEALVAPLGDAVRIERLDGEIAPATVTVPNGPVALDPTRQTADDNPMRGGQAITISAWRTVGCTAGFNVRKRDYPNQKFILTAGHCLRHAWAWYKMAGYTRLGNRAAWRYGSGGDFGVIDYTNANMRPIGTVWEGSDARDINNSREVVVGEWARKRGLTSGTSKAKRILGKGMTVNTTDGKRLTNMIKTAHCARGGDSGGPLYAQKSALGILSLGHAGDTCRSWFQPIKAALNQYNVEVY